MANQTLQLAKLLRDEDAVVELIQVNRPYWPRWTGKIKGIRAVFRLLPYLVHLWRATGKVQLFHVMANSGWSWHLFAAPAIWIGRIKGLPVVVNYRGGEADAFLNKAFLWVKPSLSRADAIIVPSAFLESVFGKRGFPTTIVPNIIDLGRFSPRPRAPAFPGRECPHLIVTRNLEPIYDNATALRAFVIVRRGFPAATLTMAGSGPERQALELLASELGIADAVTFTGRMDNEGMAFLYQDADIMINPSLADNMPISILEALASGVPVVSTDVGGIPYLVEHGRTALLVPVHDPRAMADAIVLLLGDPCMRDKLRQAGFEAARQYAWTNIRERLLSVYHDVLAKPCRAVAASK
jgi:glycosyltransferase involved in cell wall biosynthesis